jgi:beta-glucanase (GH16 family)
MGSTDISAFMHWQNATSGSQQDVYDTNVDPTQWHTYEIEWLPNSLSFYVDGTLIGHSTTNVPDTPMHWVLQTNASSEMTSADTEAGHLQIDWAVAYTPS